MTIYIIIAFLAVILAYLSGSVNYAIIVTRLVSGEDIRVIGNKNPGTSNVLRSVGKFWGFTVGFLDAMKGLVPVLIARALFFTGDTNSDFAILYLMGIAAVLGHCKPVFYHFKGGGGIGTMQGVSLFFVPVEYLVSMLIGGTIVLVFFRKTANKLSQWTPVMFVILTPFLTLAVNGLIDVPLFAHLSIGGHPAAVVAGTFAMSLVILAMNLKFMGQRKQEMDAIKNDEDWDPDTSPR